MPAGVGAMAALLKLPEGKLDGILAEAAQGEVVTAANFNSPDQVVIAGHAGAVQRAMDLAKGGGRKTGCPASRQRAVPLPSDGAGAGPTCAPNSTPSSSPI